MIITILGFENKSYTKKDTGEYVECLELSFTKPYKSDKGVGDACGTEFVSGKAFPEQFKKLIQLNEKAVGLKASISKDVTSFGGKMQSVLDELEILT